MRRELGATFPAVLVEIRGSLGVEVQGNLPYSVLISRVW